MKKKITLFLCLLLGLFTSCMVEDKLDTVKTEGDEVVLFFTVSSPSAGLPSTRSHTNTVDETAINNIAVIIFEDEGSGFRYKYLVKGQKISKQGTDSYTFESLVLQTDHPVKMYMVANSNTQVGEHTLYDDEETIRKRIIKSFAATNPEIDLPMFGEATLPGGINQSTSVEAELVRSMARVDIINNATDNFQLKTIQLFRVNNKIQLIPDQMVDNMVSAPSIPSDATQTIHTQAVDVVAIKDISMGDVYLPESRVVQDPEQRMLNATCIVIGGIFDNDDKVTYYRLDFAPDVKKELFGQVLRNHRYIFKINKVSGSGWEWPDEAANNKSIQTDSDIVVWNDETTNMVFDGFNFFGVSERYTEIEHYNGMEKSVDVFTDLDTYTLYWTDEDGNKKGTGIKPGESVDDPFEARFNVAISTDGKSITYKTRKENESGGDITRHLHIEAGRLRINMTITQTRYTMGYRQIFIYGSGYELGSFGDEIFKTGATPSRPAEFRKKLKNLNNFGPGGTVHFDGFKFGAFMRWVIYEELAGMFDVLYFPYQTDPNNETMATAEIAYNWINENRNRVLIVHYDNANTNPRLLNLLGVTSTRTPSWNIYTVGTLSSEAPEFITDGPFGKVDPGFVFRIYDNHYREIPLDIARQSNITPILLSVDGGVLMGVDVDRHIIYVGDIDFYYSAADRKDNAITSGENINNQQDILLCNLWAWITTIVLKE